MAPNIIDKIPSTIDDLFSIWGEEPKEYYKLTLVHKDDKDITCFLHSNFKNLDSHEEHPIIFGIRGGTNKDISYIKNVHVKKRECDDGFYYVFNQHGKKSYVLPYIFTDEPPSLIINKTLTNKIVEYFVENSSYFNQSLDFIGEHGIIKGVKQLISCDHQLNPKRALLIEIENSISDCVCKYFESESNPSRLADNFSYHSDDVPSKQLFEMKSRVLAGIKLIGLLTVIPYSFGNQIGRYFSGQLENENKDSAHTHSSFSHAYPNLEKGTKYLFDAAKHFANLSTYTCYLAVTGLALAYAPLYVSFPLVCGAAISGGSILGSLFTSRFRDSSGFISKSAEIYYQSLLKKSKHKENNDD